MRKNGSNGQRLDIHDKDIFNLKKNAERINEEFNAHIQLHIKEDLMQPKFPGSGKFLYTYEEIAMKYDIPKSQVQKVAEENNLTRRNIKIIG